MKSIFKSIVLGSCVIALARVALTAAPVPVDGGGAFSAACVVDGTLWSWGYNGYGQLGISNYVNQIASVRVGGESNWVGVAGGQYHALGVWSDGSLWAWGRNNYGQLGTSNTVSQRVPARVGGESNWNTVAAGDYHSFGVRSDGSLWAWGHNGYGQLGVSNTVNRNAPARVGAETNWMGVSAGDYHSLGLRADGTLWAWGYNGYGQLGLSNYANQTVPVPVEGTSNWIAMAAGQYHSLGVRADGTLWAWGYNGYGQLGTGDLADQIAPAPVGTASNWASVAAGAYHSLAVRADGTLWAWGWNGYGQLGTSDTADQIEPVRVGVASNWVGVVAGDYHSLGLRSDGTLWAWGNNGSGELGISNNFSQSAPVRVPLDVPVPKDRVPRSGRVLWAAGFMDFGEVVGATNVVRQLWLVNLGSEAVTVASLSHGSGAFSGDFAGVIPAGGWVIVPITFAPQEPGRFVESITVNSDAEGAPVGIEARGVRRATLAEALGDAFGWTNGGSGVWAEDMDIAHDGVASGRSGTVSDAQESWVETTIAGPGTLEFWWKVDSEQDGDFLALHVDGEERAAISGTVGWEQVATTLGEGPHAVRWVYRKNGSVAAGQDRGWVDEVRFILGPPVPLVDALDATNVHWTTRGVPAWQAVADETSDGMDAAASGAMGDGGYSLICTRVEGPGTVRFWRRAAVGGAGIWRFAVDGQSQETVASGEEEWAGRELVIGEGTHILEWGVERTSTNEPGPRAWLDRVAVFGTNNGPPKIWADPASPDGMTGGDAHLSAGVIGQEPMIYQWRKNGVLLAGETNRDLLLRDLELGDSGWYDVVASNELGAVTSAVARVLVMIAPTPFDGGYQFSGSAAADGRLWTWGENGNGQLGISSYENQLAPARVGGDSNWVSMSSGRYHSLGLRSDGTLWAWGYNGYGQLGTSNWNTQTAPVKVGGASSCRDAVAGDYCSFAVRSDGTLWAWGRNDYGQLGISNTASQNAPVRVGNESNWVAVAASDYHSLGLRSDGTLWAWGQNGYGQLGISNAVNQIAPVRVGAGSNWVGISAGYYHSLAARSDGTLWAWGYNGSGQLGISNTVNQLAPVRVGGGSNWVGIAAGNSHSLAARSDGTLWAWGYNGYGQLGISNTVNQSAPVRVGGGSNWVGIAAGYCHSMAARSDGTLWAWGYNNYGQLGISNAVNQYAPVRVGLDVPVRKDRVARSGRVLWAAGQLDFGEVFGATNIVRDAWLMNIGADPVTVGSLSHGSGAFSGDYSGVIPGGGWVTVPITFSPPAPGAYSNLITVISDTEGPPASMAAQGVRRATLAEALGGAFSWSSGGCVGWEGDMDIARDGVAAGRSGTASDGQMNWVETMVTGPGTLRFWWKVDSEQGGDFLALLVDGEERAAISGAVDWEQVVTTFGEGSHTVRWVYRKNGSVSAGQDRGWVDEVGFVPISPVPIVEALDSTGLEWTTRGMAPWQAVTDETSDGVDAAMSGDLGVDSHSVIGTLVEGPATVAFWRKVAINGEGRWRVLVNGAERESLGSSQGEWVERVIGVGEGTHRLEWQVEWTGSNGPGPRAWLDRVLVSGTNEGPPAIWSEPVSVAGQAGGDVGLSVGLFGREPFAYQWRKDGVPLTGETNRNLSLRNLESGDSGSYDVVASNDLGAVTSAVARVLVMVPAAPFDGGQGFSGAIDAQGSAWFWGGNSQGQLGISTFGGLQTTPLPNGAWGDLLGIAVGYYHSLGVRADGTLWSCGDNGYGQLGISNLVNQNAPVLAGASSNWTEVAAGYSHSLGLRADGTLWAWGRNTYGQLGVGDNTGRTAPSQIGGGSNWVMIAAGNHHSLGLDVEGRLWAWGYNFGGQLGNGNTASQSRPVRVGSDSNWISVAAGGNHSLGLRSDGTLWAWGYNYYGALGTYSTGNRSTPVQVGDGSNWMCMAAGEDHSLGVREDGTLWAWGRNNHGQLGTANTWNEYGPRRVGHETNWLRVAAGWSHSLALRSNGSLWASGRNVDGELGDGSTESSTRFIRAGIGVPVFKDRIRRSGAALWVTGDLDFGGVSGVTNVVRDLWLVNLGSVAVNVDSISHNSGAFTGDFSGAIDPGKAAVVPITFSPPAPGLYVDTITVHSGADTGPFVGRARGVHWADIEYALGRDSVWRTGGDGDWVGDPGVSTDGVAGARSGVIGPDQETWIETAVRGQGTLRFQWRMSSEHGGDGLMLEIDGVERASIWGHHEEWRSEALHLGSGLHTVRWRFYGSDSSGGELGAGWVDNVSFEKARSVSVAEALDCPSLTWASGGAAPWEGWSTPSHDGEDAARSGAITHGQESWMEATVEGPGTMSFWWSISAVWGDALELIIDGVARDAIRGEEDWSQVLATLGEGSHTVRWRFAKDDWDSSGSDSAWIDDVEFLPGPPVPLAEALNATNLQWISLGVPWEVDDREHCDGVASGRASEDGSRLHTLLRGPGFLSFVWRVSSGNEDTAVVLTLDGTDTAYAYGDTNWISESIIIDGPGDHVATWWFWDSSDAGTTGWLDRVVYYAKDEAPPIVTAEPMGWVADAGGSVRLSVETYGAEAMTYQWRYGGVPLAFGTNAHCVLGGLSGASTGSYDVVIGNPMGVATSAVASVTLADLGSAVAESGGLALASSGEATWFAQTNVALVGSGALQSGGIGDAQTSFLEARAQGPGVLRFMRKVSSEEWGDWYSFSIDGSVRETLSGDQDWAEATFVIGPGEHVLRWEYAKDSYGADLSDAAWIDSVSWVGNPVISHGEAVDFDGLEWTSGGSAPWWGQDGTTRDGVDALASGTVGEGEESWTEAMIEGPGTLTFWWRISAGGTDRLEFLIDGVVREIIEGDAGWSRVVATWASGGHKVRWRYVKSGSAAYGADAGWIDDLNFTPGPPLPFTDAVGGTNLEWTSARPPWEVDSQESRDGGGSIRGVVDESRVTTVLPGSGLLSFSWRLSRDNDTELEFSVENGEWTYLYGETNWCTERVIIQGTGQQWAGWEFEDWSGDGCTGWLDEVVFIAKDDLSPVLTNLPQRCVGDRGASVSLSVGAYGADPMQYQWRRDGVALADQTNGVLFLEAIDESFEGGYDALVSNSRGWVTSGVAVVSITNLAAAADADGQLVFSSSGSAPWLSQSAITRDGIDAMQSGAVGDREESWIETRVQGPGTLSFWWSVSCEGADDLELVIDGVVVDDIDGEEDWEQEVWNLGPGGHTVRWRYVKDGSVAEGADAGWVDQVTFVPWAMTSLGGALDAAELEWSTGALAPWCGWSASGLGSDGEDAAASGTLIDGQESWMEAPVQGPGTLRFWWNLAGGWAERLEFLIDGELRESIEGGEDWREVVAALADGIHTLRWRLVSGATGSESAARGWVDRVSFIAGPPVPLADAVGGSNLHWTSASPPWDVDSGESLDGAGSARCVWDDSRISVVLPGPGVLSFSWRVSAEDDTEIDVSIDGEGGTSLYGVTNWAAERIVIAGPGSHKVVWEFEDWSSDGRAGWLDEVVFTPVEDLPPVVERQPDGWIGDEGALVLLSVETGGSEPIAYQWRRDGVPIAAGTSSVMTIHDLGATSTGVYDVVASKPLGAVTSAVARVSIGSLAPAISGYGELAVATSGDAPWVRQTQVVYGGSEALQSGAIGHGQMSVLLSRLEGPGRVTFWRRVSSEAFWDRYRFEVNGSEVESLSGDVPWGQVGIDLGPGQHVLRWSYLKDETGTAGEDAAWIDEVEFVAGSAYEIWARDHGLDGEDADATAVPLGEGVSNLLKFAFNIDPGVVGGRIMVPGIGTTGLPSIRVEKQGTVRKLVVEYVRRRNAGLIYEVEFSDSLMVDSWQRATQQEDVTPIDEAWDRVRVEDSVTIDERVRRFGRVKVGMGQD